MEKEYKFLAVAKEIAKGYVIAKNEDEAKKKILDNDYEDIWDTYDMELEKIVEIEEVTE
jgi:hypothetical protein